MSLGRPVGADKSKRLIVLLTIIAIIVLTISGYIFVKDRGDGQPQPVERLRSLRSTLDLMLIEYSEAVENGSIKLESEYQVALSLAQRAATIYAELEDELNSINREASVRLGELIDEIVKMVEAKEDPKLVEKRVIEALEIIDSLISAIS